MTDGIFGCPETRELMSVDDWAVNHVYACICGRAYQNTTLYKCNVICDTTYAKFVNSVDLSKCRCLNRKGGLSCGEEVCRAGERGRFYCRGEFGHRPNCEYVDHSIHPSAYPECKCGANGTMDAYGYCKCPESHMGMFCERQIDVKRYSTGSNSYVIAGGTVAALFGVFILVCICYMLVRRNRNTDTNQTPTNPNNNANFGVTSELPLLYTENDCVYAPTTTSFATEHGATVPQAGLSPFGNTTAPLSEQITDFVDDKPPSYDEVVGKTS